MTFRQDVAALDLPPIFLLPTHLPPDELHRLEDSIPSLTYDVNEAEIVLGRISRRERAMFELRRVKLETEPLDASPTAAMTSSHGGGDDDELPSPKRTRLSATAQEDVAKTVKVLKLTWLSDSLEKGTVLPVDDYILYEGRKNVACPQKQPRPRAAQTAVVSAIIERAEADQAGVPAKPSRHPNQTSGHGKPQPPALLHQTTSEHDLILPELPDFLFTTYSCQRPTPLTPPNADFIEELKKIRTIRLLQGDTTGVRAYSTSIAALAAYPHQLQGPLDVARLPGCAAKIARLYQEWQELGWLKEAKEATEDEHLVILQRFYNIWGVGDATARDFYRKGWKDLDDIVEYGWQSLSRVQQIGVKYYNEFQVLIPRVEVEAIAASILEHARSIDPGFEMVIVGGYRRGKQDSGDVDVVLSHRDEARTLNFVEKVVLSLEKEMLITHTLSLTTRSSERGQQPLAWKGESGKGHGFDTLDKALVVWQDTGRPGAPHRRVDIIVSPWKTAGCAVVGWSGGTTFQRDLRLYCNQEKRLKFDSSGVRSRTDGKWVDLESEAAGGAGGPARVPAPDMETAERRVFTGLGLTWRPPEERCTG